jgi:hypothetical protein
MRQTQQSFSWDKPSAKPQGSVQHLINPLDTAVSQTPTVRNEAEPAVVPLAQRELHRPQTWEEKHAQIEKMTEAALSQLGESLAAGKSETLTRYLAAMAKFHDYSFGNQMLIALQAPEATHVAGFHAWKKFGRSVMKGEHGILILAPVIRKVGEVEDRREDGRAEKTDVRRMVNVKPVYVFDVSQTEGKELPKFASVQGEPAEATPLIKAFISAKGIELEYAKSLGGAKGRSEGGKIYVEEGLEPPEEFHVLVHEVAHELLHRGERRAETTRRSRELEAESVAFVVCTARGLDAKQSSTDYIHLYRGDTKMLAESMEHIRRTANEILVALSPGKNRS